MLTPDEVQALCKRWQIQFAVHPSTRTLIVPRTPGPIDPDRLPSPIEARDDLQRLIHTYARTSQIIIQLLWDEEE